ncbi:MAG: prepilin peptidase [Burkholderiales bacterium]
MCGVFGLAIGSFINVVVHRLPIMLRREWDAQCAELSREPDDSAPTPLPVYNLITPRSSCPACGHALAVAENLPLLSYLWLRGRCAHCQAPISARYPIVELASGLLSFAVAWHFGFTPTTLGALFFTWALIALTFIDVDTKLLPDSITLPLLWAGLLFNFSGGFTDLRSAVLGAVAGYLLLWSVYWAYRLIRKREGMGYGDFKLLAAIGAWLGWQMLPMVVLLSSLVGAVSGIALMVLARRGKDVPIPFGPYLAGGALIALFWGEAINQAYLGGF